MLGIPHIGLYTTINKVISLNLERFSLRIQIKALNLK